MTFDAQAQKQEIYDVILDHGFAVIHLTATAARPPVTYTVGRTLYARPELVVSGIAETEAHDLLAEAVALDHDAPLEPEVPCRLGDREFNVRSVDPKKAGMVFAFAVFGTCEALQLLEDKEII